MISICDSNTLNILPIYLLVTVFSNQIYPLSSLSFLYLVHIYHIKPSTGSPNPTAQHVITKLTPRVSQQLLLTKLSLLLLLLPQLSSVMVADPHYCHLLALGISVIPGRGPLSALPNQLTCSQVGSITTITQGCRFT